MFALFFLGMLVSDWAHLEVLTGLSFVAGCALAARYTKRDGLLTVVASPPLLFAIALIITQAFSSHAASARRTAESLAEGTILTLAGVAPWLFAGMIVAVIIAMCRGLPQCFRDLMTELRGDAAGTSRPARPGERRTST
jgi:hypothetical protein